MAMVEFSSALEKAKAIAAKLTAGQKRGLESDGDKDSKRVRPGLGSLALYGAGVGGTVGVLQKQEEITIPTSKVGLIIGKNGETLKRIELDTGTHISVPHGQSISSKIRTVTIEGDDKQREAAKYEIFGILAGKIDTLVVPQGQKKVEYTVPKSRSKFIEAKDLFLVGLVIGRGGEVIKNIQYRSGAKLEADRNPDSHGSLSKIFIVGTDEMIEMAKRMIEEAMDPLDGAPNEIMFVPDEKVGLIIGRGGETIKAIQSDCDVRITIETDTAPQGRAINIQGLPDAVKYAKEMISERVYGYATAYQTYESEGPVDPFAPGFKGYNESYYGYNNDPYASNAYYYQQQQYPQAGGGASSSGAASSTDATQAAQGQVADATATMPTDPNDPNYAAYYAAMVNDPNYAAWYNYYYGNGAYAQGEASAEQQSGAESTENKPSETTENKPSESTESKPSQSTENKGAKSPSKST